MTLAPDRSVCFARSLEASRFAGAESAASAAAGGFPHLSSPRPPCVPAWRTTPTSRYNAKMKHRTAFAVVMALLFFASALAQHAGSAGPPATEPTEPTAADPALLEHNLDQATSSL